jgi:hypothetical protein
MACKNCDCKKNENATDENMDLKCGKGKRQFKIDDGVVLLDIAFKPDRKMWNDIKEESSKRIREASLKERHTWENVLMELEREID